MFAVLHFIATAAACVTATYRHQSKAQDNQPANQLTNYIIAARGNGVVLHIALRRIELLT